MSPALVKAAIDFTSVKLSGSTMTGSLILNGDPTQNLGAATKQYVDNKVGGVIQQVYNGKVVNDATNNFSIDVSNAKFLIVSLYLQSPSSSTQNNVYIYDSTGDTGGRVILSISSNYTSILFAKTYDNHFASSKTLSSDNAYFGSLPFTFNTTFKVGYSVSTVYFTAYAMF